MVGGTYLEDHFLSTKNFLLDIEQEDFIWAPKNYETNGYITIWIC